MGNGNSVEPKQDKHRRRKGDFKSTDGSKPRRSTNRNPNGNANGGRTPESTKPIPKTPRATNPFIIFFLRMRSKQPREPVTVIARTAGKLWARMSLEERKKYIDLANAEKKRREERSRKRKTRN